MLQSLLITSDRAAADLLADLIRQSGQISLEQVHCPAPSHYQLCRALNTRELDVIFLDTTQPDEAGMLCAEILKKTTRTAIVGFSVQRTSGHEGVTPHMLVWPFSVAGLVETVRRAVRQTCAVPLNNVFCVVPAKGGDGATTVTLNVACHLTMSLGKSVLVAEADLRSGTMAERLNAKPAQSIAQSLACADNCISLIWPRHVSSKFGVDWMLTNRERNPTQPAWCDYRHLLAFVSGRYDYTLVDLPDLVDEDTCDVALLSQKTFVVTTPEVLSLRLARQRIEELEFFGVPKARIQVLVNRYQSRDMSIADVAKTLGCEVGGVFPNDYPVVSKSILDGNFISDGTKLGRAYRSLAGVIAGSNKPAFGLESKSSMFGFLTSPGRSTARA